MSVIVVPGTISKVTTMADSSIRIWVDTQEVTPDIGGQLLGMKNKLGIVAFSLEEYTDEFLKEINLKGKMEVEGQKTKSRRLRDVLFAYYSQNPKGFETFDPFYEWHMEKFISIVKSKLDQ